MSGENYRTAQNSFLTISDFSDRVHSVQTKFFSVSVISIFISLFDLDVHSSFFGFKGAGVNERIIEFGFALTAISFSALFFMRILEEREVFRNLEKSAENLLKDYISKIDAIKQAHDSYSSTMTNSGFLNGLFQSQLENSGKNISFTLKGIESESEQFSGKEYLQKAERDARQRLVGNGQYNLSELNALKENIKGKSARFDRLLKEWEAQLDELKKFQINPKESKKFARKQRSRLFAFDVISPALVTVLVITSFFFPDFVLEGLEFFLGSSENKATNQ